MIPKLFFIVPCFNEEESIEHTANQLIAKCKALEDEGKISPESAILFVDDGSTDGTWALIQKLNKASEKICGISLAANYGHQIALYAGLLEVKDICDIAISLDADGQNDINAVGVLLDECEKGSEIVCAVRENRNTDSGFKKYSARLYYKLLQRAGKKIIPDHSDFRLVTAKAIHMLEDMPHDAIFLRSDFLKLPLNISTVKYDHKMRAAGSSKYSLRKMLRLGTDGLISNGILRAKRKNACTEFKVAERIIQI